MGNNSSGFQNETNIIDALNNKKITELNTNLKKFIKFLFPDIDNNSIISAISGKKGQKPDLIIEINNTKKYVSVKKGSGNSVHQEDVDLFMNFLTSLNIPLNIKIELLKYHWADGTTDGTGKIRVSSADYKKEHENEINLINDSLNKPDILKALVNRILFKGVEDSNELVDVIYYGKVEEGIWATREEIINYISNHSFSNNSIHFGPLSYQIWNRCLNYNPKTEDRRNTMQVKWGSLEVDLKNIEMERDSNE